MRYSAVASAVLIGAASASLEGGVVSQLPDGQVQAPTGPVENPVISSPVEQPAEEPTSVVDETIYQTQTFTVTSCAPTVTVCPATTAPYVTTSVVPFVSGTPVETHPAPTSINSPVEETNQAPIPEETQPAPTSDNSPIQETPIASGVCPPSTCPASTCPPAVTSYVTVTVAPSGVPTSGPVPGFEAPNAGDNNGAGIPGDSGVNNPSESPVEGESNIPTQGGSNVPSEGPVEDGSNIPGQSPVEGGAGVIPGSEGVAIPSTVDNSPVQPPFATGPAVVPGASGIAPIGTASTGGVFPGPTGAPITPFTGAASTFSGSFVAAGLAALAAIFFV
ncbi:MAG: hypothetical protein LQ337_006511 [Flavoplaca oasis]|nr:MAG: hypothetical protein LQ337_006511 [Flavoplaca oasis]